jgi:hypothetical protein
MQARTDTNAITADLAPQERISAARRLMTASEFSGDKVLNLQEELLGTICELMIDVHRGRVAYAVMASGGFLGLGQRLFAIPWSVLTHDVERKCFVLDAEKSTFEDAPGFDKEHWPTTDDEAALWDEHVQRHYEDRSRSN